jgi:hypothetical protein
MSQPRPSPAKMIAARYREILPLEFQVDTRGHIVHARFPGGRFTFFFRRIHSPRASLTPGFRLEQFARFAFAALPAQVGNSGIH